MTQEDKQLLLIDLCARLPYGVKVENTSFSEPQVHTLFGRVSDEEFLMLETYKSVGGEDYRRVTDDVHYTGYLESIKPYLRPMLSMTEEEEKEFCKISGLFKKEDGNYFSNHLSEWGNSIITEKVMVRTIDWLNARQFDYRGLIPMGLALEAPKDMYKTE